jgi:hypothetical protein
LGQDAKPKKVGILGAYRLRQSPVPPGFVQFRHANSLAELAELAELNGCHTKLKGPDILKNENQPCPFARRFPRAAGQPAT